MTTTKTIVTQLHNVSNIFDDARWKSIGHAAEQAYGFYPNRMYHNAAFRLAAVTVERNRTGPEFHLCKNALLYLLKAMESGKIEHAYVVLKERGLWRVVASATIKRVWENLQGHPPHYGTHNRYWIIDLSFQVAKPMMPF